MTNKEAIKHLKNINSRYPCSLDTTFQDECEMIALNLAIKALEERPKGKWIRTGSLGNGNAHYTCSNCSYGDEHAECQEVPYCWHCGARMDGDV